MKTPSDAYEAYKVRCHGVGVQPMSRDDYEHFMSMLPAPSENNIDAILRNNHKKKDR